MYHKISMRQALSILAACNQGVKGNCWVTKFEKSPWIVTVNLNDVDDLSIEDVAEIVDMEPEDIHCMDGWFSLSIDM